MFAEDSRPTTSQFTLRVAILGAFAIAAFAIIFFRLWFLQVLSSEDYVRAAEDNQVREVKVDAPRGEILASNGRVLVGNGTSLALQVRSDRLPRRRAEREQVLGRVARIAGVRKRSIRRRLREQEKLLSGAPVTILRDVPYRMVFFLRENAAQFPGVSVERVFVRRYPQGTLGAHMFGYTGEVDADELELPRFKKLEAGDTVGKFGLELEYDHLLRGRPGITTIQVDALGRQRGGGSGTTAREAEAGNNLVTSIDLKVQKAGENALAGEGLPGAFVAMDVDSGSILGLGSYPTFDPRQFIPPVSSRYVKSVYSDAAEKPAFNRAIQADYPAASTFKAITSIAAMESGAVTPTELINDTGTYKIDVLTLKNAGDPDGDGPLPPPAFGSINIVDAMRVSSDVFFYEMGRRLDDPDLENGLALQNWASELGIGSPTGIDLPGELGGLVPTPEYRNELYAQAAEPDSPGGTKRIYPEETVDPWTTGQNINLAIGQGDLRTNPIQMAVAYAAIGNGGDVVRPHLATAVEDPAGRVVQEVAPEPRGHVKIDDGVRATVLEGLREAAMEPTGTSYNTFAGYPIQVAGKTGTAERGFYNNGTPVPDQAWYVALAPADDPEIVVALTIERAGFGAETAAPAVRRILDAYFGVTGGRLEGAAPVESVAPVPSETEPVPGIPVAPPADAPPAPAVEPGSATGVAAG